MTHEMIRWYERQRWPYAGDRQLAETYAEWLKEIPWRFFCTFTFAWPVSDPQARKVFSAYINRVERYLMCDVAYVRGDEKRFSGCGKPPSGRHFHVLLACVNSVWPWVLEKFWMDMAGKRSDNAGAKVERYDPALNGASYVMKLINETEGDWDFRNLHLFLPSVTLEPLNRRRRRNLRRHLARKELFRSAILSGSPVSPISGQIILRSEPQEQWNPEELEAMKRML